MSLYPIDTLKASNRWNEVCFMGALSFFCVILFVARVSYSGRIMFHFLNWNLFLAFVPWALTTWLTVHTRFQKSKVAVGLVVCLWLLFFPNAPYILTDLFHLTNPYRGNVPLWFDLVMILSFAWTGLLFGFLSLWDIERVLARFITRKTAIPMMSVLLLFVSSFGIYLGRFLRWNSWDIFRDPVRLVYDIGDRVAKPHDHPSTWGVTLLLGLFLCILYFSFKLVNNRKTEIL